jgi:hypothetical protein
MLKVEIYLDKNWKNIEGLEKYRWEKYLKSHLQITRFDII